MRLEISPWYLQKKKKKPKYNLYTSQYYTLEIKKLQWVVTLYTH